MWSLRSVKERGKEQTKGEVLTEVRRLALQLTCSRGLEEGSMYLCVAWLKEDLRLNLSS